MSEISRMFSHKGSLLKWEWLENKRETDIFHWGGKDCGKYFCLYCILISECSIELKDHKQKVQNKYYFKIAFNFRPVKVLVNFIQKDSSPWGDRHILTQKGKMGIKEGDLLLQVVTSAFISHTFICFKRLGRSSWVCLGKKKEL